MNNCINVYVPKEMAGYAPDLEFFFSLMVRKLHTNRHKGVSNNLDPRTMLGLALEEVAEAELAMAQEGQFEAAVECADVANFAFLAASSCLQMTREQFHGGQKEK